MKVRYAATALAEADDILAYIAKDNPAAAVAVASAIRTAARRLGVFPHIGAPTDLHGIYLKIVRPYRYPHFLQDRRRDGRYPQHPSPGPQTPFLNALPFPARRSGIVTSFSDCGLPVNQHPLLFNSTPP